MLTGWMTLTWFDAVSLAMTVASIVLIQFINATLATVAANHRHSTNTTTTTAATTPSTPTTPTSPIIITAKPNLMKRISKAVSLDETALSLSAAKSASALTSASTSASTATPLPATPESPTTNGKLLKQKSEHNEDISPTSSSTNSSPNSSARNSTNTPHNLLFLPSPPSADNLYDEYNEDEDTISLENLFPCDQSEIYASKKISYIIDELIQTEVNYVNNLSKGLKNYGCLNEKRQDVPEVLQSVEGCEQLLGNIKEILKLHEQNVLPLMLRNQHDLKTLFDEFAAHIDKNEFYCYVIFMMHKKASLQIRQEQREWFQAFQTEINDKLGIDSFLVQPVQRLTRYPLLLQQFISEFYKSGISCKPVLISVCKLETRMRRLLEVVNQAEEILNIEELSEQLKLEQQGHFRKSTEFDVYHHRSRKKYHAKIFLFDHCLLCAEIRKRRLAYRLHYSWDSVELRLATSKSVTILSALPTSASPTGNGHHNGSGDGLNGLKPELDLSSPEAISVTQWLRYAQRIIEKARSEAIQQGKFSLPMDLVLGVCAAIWLIWQYL